jgi:hypothetical protein
MGAVLILLTLSALIGFGMGWFSCLAIATASVVLALLSAFVLQLQGLDTVTGIAILVACLTVSQAAYLIGRSICRCPGGLFQKQGDKAPG